MKPVIYNNKQLALHKFFYKGKSYVKVGYCSWIYRSHIYIEVANMDGPVMFVTTEFYIILLYFNGSLF